MNLKDAENLAIVLISQHLENKNWQFVWTDHINALGQCSYRKKQIRLSKRWTVALPEIEVKDTILHEIAHALTPGDSHGSKWKAACISIGAKPDRLADTTIGRSDIAMPTHKLVDTTTGRVIKEYFRAPNKSMRAKIETYYIKGRKQETLGKLEIQETSLLDLL